MKNVVIIIPTYNESGNVTPVTKALGKVFNTLSSDYSPMILFVDDQSPDGTSTVIRTLIKKYPYVKLLENKRKGGLGHAYKKGMIYATDKLKADIVFEFDADLSHDPTKIPQMLDSIKSGSDRFSG